MHGSHRLIDYLLLKDQPLGLDVPTADRTILTPAQKDMLILTVVATNVQAKLFVYNSLVGFLESALQVVNAELGVRVAHE